MKIMTFENQVFLPFLIIMSSAWISAAGWSKCCLSKFQSLSKIINKQINISVGSNHPSRCHVCGIESCDNLRDPYAVPQVGHYKLDQIRSFKKETFLPGLHYF